MEDDHNLFRALTKPTEPLNPDVIGDDGDKPLIVRTPICFKRLDNKAVCRVKITFDDGTEIWC